MTRKEFFHSVLIGSIAAPVAVILLKLLFGDTDIFVSVFWLIAGMWILYFSIRSNFPKEAK